MAEFDPGPGWRKVDVREYRPFSKGMRRAIFYDENAQASYYLYEEPPPPLPTEPYTVIRVTWRDPEYMTGNHIFTLASDRYWCPQNRAGEALRPDEMAALITGFEVLAEPRATSLERMVARDMEVRKATAKAVLDRVREELEASGFEKYLAPIAREFGVEEE